LVVDNIEAFSEFDLTLNAEYTASWCPQRFFKKIFFNWYTTGYLNSHGVS